MSTRVPLNCPACGREISVGPVVLMRPVVVLTIMVTPRPARPDPGAKGRNDVGMGLEGAVGQRICCTAVGRTWDKREDGGWPPRLYPRGVGYGRA